MPTIHVSLSARLWQVASGIQQLQAGHRVCVWPQMGEWRWPPTGSRIVIVMALCTMEQGDASAPVHDPDEEAAIYRLLDSKVLSLSLNLHLIEYQQAF